MVNKINDLIQSSQIRTMREDIKYLKKGGFSKSMALPRQEIKRNSVNQIENPEAPKIISQKPQPYQDQTKEIPTIKIEDTAKLEDNIEEKVNINKIEKNDLNVPAVEQGPEISSKLKGILEDNSIPSIGKQGAQTAPQEEKRVKFLQDVERWASLNKKQGNNS